MIIGKFITLATGLMITVWISALSQSSAMAQDLGLFSLFTNDDGYEGAQKAGRYAYRRSYAKDHANHRARVRRYKGPVLGLSQIRSGTGKKSADPIHIRSASLGLHSLRVESSKSAVGIGQLKTHKYWVDYPKNAGLPEQKGPICALPYYHNAFNDLFVPNESGFPPIAMVLSQPKKEWKFDPRLLFAKPVEEEKDLFGIEIESAPADMEIGVEVIFYH